MTYRSRRVAAERDKRCAAFLRADHLEDRGRAREAFRLFLRLAEQGHVASMTRVATSYFSGHGAPKNIRRCLWWEIRAARLGDPVAAFNLGVTYRRLGNVAQEEFWFRRALAEGEGGAGLELAKLALRRGERPQIVADRLRSAQANRPLSQDDEEEIAVLLAQAEAQSVAS
jgi:TPR repeat protein